MTTVLAHGTVQRVDIPIPEVAFAWAAAAVLVISFVALASLWPAPKLERATWRPLPGGALLASRPVQVVCGAIGIALLALVVWAGWAGMQSRPVNFAPTFVYVTFWVGLVFASLLFGDVFRALNPWRAVGRAVGAVARERWTVRPYPERLGRWPAALGLLVFTWTELVGRYADFPERIATCAVLYSAVTWLAMARYGTEAWASRGEAFGVYFNLFSRLSVFETRDGVVGRRPLLAGLPRVEPLAGTVAVVAVMIGTVTFDGLSQGATWKEDLGIWLFDAFSALGFSDTLSTDLAGTAGLLGAVAVVAGFYRLGISGAQSVGGGFSAERLRLGFVHSLVPIALVYAVAHYFSALLYEGQTIAGLFSDPLGRGWDLLGTAGGGVTPNLISQNGIWYIQIGAVVLGHVGGLVLAHDRALVLYRDAGEAVRSQYWMLAIMVGFTSLALWLLSQANA